MNQMNQSYSWHVSGDTITVITQKGEVKHLSRTNKYGDTVLRLLVNQADEADILTMLDRAAAMRKTVESISAKVGKDELKISLANGVPEVTYNGETLGGVVVDKIVEFMDQGLPVESLAKFLVRLMANPSFNSRQQLYSFLQVLQAPITCEGTFLAYKGVRADYKDCHTGTIDNSPGAVPPRMDRKNVDDNPKNHCSKGSCGPLAA